MKTNLTLTFFLILSLCTLRAAPVIDSVVTTTSLCLNSGTITVYAHGSSALSYSLSGTEIFPAQVGNTFTALLAGSYTVLVTNAAHDTVRRAVTITGHYKPLKFHPKMVYPRCRKSNDLILVGSRDSGTGRGPFLWELAAPSPVTAAQQSGDTFHVNRPGTYTIRCTDACGSIQTRFYTIDSTTAPSNFLQTGIQLSSMNCDSVIAGVSGWINGDTGNIPFPLTLTISNNHGNSASYTQTYLSPDSFIYTYTYFFSAYNYLNMSLALPHTTYNDMVYMMLVDGCGDTLTGNAQVQAPNISINRWYNYPRDSCRIGNAMTITYYMDRPNSWVVTSTSTHTIIDSGSNYPDSLHSRFNNSIPLKDLSTDTSYTVKCIGHCGDTLSTSFIWPAPDRVQPSAVAFVSTAPCLDNSSGIIVRFSGFTSYVKISILSGPASVSSNKPGYQYSQTYTYPKTYAYPALQGEMSIQNLAAGTYTYSVSDTCGHTITGSVTISPRDLVDMSHSLSYILGCEDANTIVCNLPGSSVVYYTIYNIDDSSILYGNNYGMGSQGHVYNVPSGNWALTAQYDTYGVRMNDSGLCSSIHDTISIPPYTDPQLAPLSATSCGNVLYIDAVPDPALGIQPYTYDIISGPETYDEQSGTRFEVHHYGTYTVRILDACGNGTARQISIDSLTPLVVTRVAVTDSCFSASVRGYVFRTDTTLVTTITTSSGCDSIIYIDSVFVRGNKDSLPILYAGTDTFCSQRGGTISAAHTYMSYLWSDGGTGRSVMVQDAGIYHLTVTDADGCMLTGSKSIALIDSPYITDGWVADAVVCIDDPLIIHLTVNDPYARYGWNVPDDAQYSLERAVTDSGWFTFTVSNICATSDYTLHTTEKKCDENLYVPNAFTPNGDGVNDLFQIYTSYKLKNTVLKVFNRWGEKVYEGTDESTGWDGRYKAADLPTGVYVYEVSAIWLTGHEFKRSGSVTLIR